MAQEEKLNSHGVARDAARRVFSGGISATCRITCLLILCLSCLSTLSAHAGSFDPVGAVKEEVGNLAGEGVSMVQAPVTRYLPATAVALGAFGLAYVYDSDIRAKLLSNKSHALDDAADVGTVLGDPLLHLGVAAVVYGTGVVTERPGTIALGQKMGEALLLADGSTYLLKTAIGRARPSTGPDKGRFRPFQLKTDFDSLPSLHSSSSFALASVLASETDSLAAKALCYTAASFVGFSRMYKQKHWASDIVLSAALGELAGRAVTEFHRSGKEGALRLVPAVSEGGAPLLALQGTFR